MKLRLVTTHKCNKSCEGCCNHQWDWSKIPRVDESVEFGGFSEIILTGGEPMIYPVELYMLIGNIKKVSDARLYLYTADPIALMKNWYIMKEVDGVTVSIHDSLDVFDFGIFNHAMLVKQDEFEPWTKSLRLNSFVQKDFLAYEWLQFWTVRHEMQWIDNCPLPFGEIMYQLKHPLEDRL